MNGDRSDVLALDLDGLNMVLGWIMNLVERSSEAGSNHIVDCCGSNRFSFRFDLKGEVSLLDGDNHVVGDHNRSRCLLCGVRAFNVTLKSRGESLVGRSLEASAESVLPVGVVVG